MDTLYASAQNIISVLDFRTLNDLDKAYSRMNDQLFSEIPIFVSMLKKYKNRPDDFAKILNDVIIHWGNFLNKPTHKLIELYFQTYNVVKHNEMLAQQRLMQLASEHPLNVSAARNEINELADELSDMMSGTAGLTKGLRSVGIAKRKYPKKNKSVVKNLKDLKF